MVKVTPADDGFQVCVTQPRHVVGEAIALKLAAHKRARSIAPRKPRIGAACPCNDLGQISEDFENDVVSPAL